MKPLRFHPKALSFLQEQSTAIRKELGEALRDIQRGISIGMPVSRPMPSVAAGVHELRVKDEKATVRVFYFTKLASAILVIHGFVKKTQKTPQHELELGKKRLKEAIEGKLDENQK